MFKRIFLFLLTNLLVILTISITLSLLGVRPYLTEFGINYSALLIFSFVWGMVGALISLALSRVTAKWFLGVHTISPDETNPQLNNLLRIATNLSQQAGIPLPEVGVYDSGEVNAFATGPTKHRSLVAVSRGMLERMNDEELSGVIGHEIAHIANGDMVTMTLIQGVINAFVLFFSRAIAWAVAQRFEDGRYAIQMILTIVLEIALSLLGWIVVAYFSRIREFRADAGSAQTAGRASMIAALEKLKQTKELIDEGAAPSLATLKISDRPSGFSLLFATHPPLDVRIERLKQL